MAAKDRLSVANERTLELVTSVPGAHPRGHQVLRLGRVRGGTRDTLVAAPSPPEDLPSAKDLLEETFKFQAQLLEANRNFSLALAEAWEQGGEKPAPRATKASRSTKASASTRK